MARDRLAGPRHPRGPGSSHPGPDTHGIRSPYIVRVPDLQKNLMQWNQAFPQPETRRRRNCGTPAVKHKLCRQGFRVLPPPRNTSFPTVPAAPTGRLLLPPPPKVTAGTPRRWGPGPPFRWRTDITGVHAARTPAVFGAGLRQQNDHSKRMITPSTPPTAAEVECASWIPLLRKALDPPRKLQGSRAPPSRSYTRIPRGQVQVRKTQHGIMPWTASKHNLTITHK